MRSCIVAIANAAAAAAASSQTLRKKFQIAHREKERVKFAFENVANLIK